GLKTKVTAISNASEIVAESWADESERKEFEEIIARNADGLKRVLANLESLSRAQADSKHCRNVLHPVAASEAVREHKQAANAKGVEVRVASDLPPIDL